ncbi:MAG TPA: hypothetical protein DHW49_11290 [Anaerolineae bacterium]|nr:hypothetical protein [Anaerolineae bacterium]
MGSIQVCRIVHGYNPKQQVNQWWEAKLITPEGEQNIYREEYQDDKYKSDTASFLGHMFNLTFNQSKLDQEDIKSRELMNSVHAKLIAKLMQDGWEPTSNDSNGRINMMKRVQPQ